MTKIIKVLSSVWDVISVGEMTKMSVLMGECEKGLMVHCPFKYKLEGIKWCQQILDSKQVKRRWFCMQSGVNLQLIAPLGYRC